MELYLTIASVGVGVAGLVYAYMTNRANADLRALVRSSLQGLAGNIDIIHKNPVWADEHFSRIQQRALNLERGNDHVKSILDHAHLGARDFTAAERMLRNLLNEVLTIQEGMFGTRIMTHPDHIHEQGS